MDPDRISLEFDVHLGVNEAGNVDTASLADIDVEFAKDAEHPETIRLALREAKRLKFRPFVRNGRAVDAHVRVFVPVYRYEDVPKTHIPFPAMTDQKTAVISVSRVGCCGGLPHGVRIHGDGRVEFFPICPDSASKEDVERISPTQFKGFVQDLKKADFYSLKNLYHTSITDLMTTIVDVEIDGKRKVLRDYAGEVAGMPHAIAEIEKNISHVVKMDERVKRIKNYEHCSGKENLPPVFDPAMEAQPNDQELQ